VSIVATEFAASAAAQIGKKDASQSRSWRPSWRC